MLIGIILYISIFKAEVGSKLKPKSPTQEEALFTYRYGYSFILYIIGILLVFCSGLLNVFLYTGFHNEPTLHIKAKVYFFTIFVTSKQFSKIFGCRTRLASVARKNTEKFHLPTHPAAIQYPHQHIVSCFVRIPTVTCIRLTSPKVSINSTPSQHLKCPHMNRHSVIRCSLVAYQPPPKIFLVQRKLETVVIWSTTCAVLVVIWSQMKRKRNRKSVQWRDQRIFTGLKTTAMMIWVTFSWLNQSSRSSVDGGIHYVQCHLHWVHADA